MIAFKHYIIVRLFCNCFRITNFRPSNSNNREMNKNIVNNQQISRWQTKQDRNASLETVETTDGVEEDSRNSSSRTSIQSTKITHWNNWPRLEKIKLSKTVIKTIVNREPKPKKDTGLYYDVSGQELFIKTDKTGNVKIKDVEKINRGTDLNFTE